MKKWVFLVLFVCGTALAIGGTARTLLMDTITSSVTNGDITLTPNGSGDVIVSSGTATTVPYFDASKQLISSAVTPTELGYLTGVTSAIQTQLNTAAPMTTQGDAIYGGASGVPTRLAIGTANQVLAVNSGATAPEWVTAGTFDSLSPLTTQGDILYGGASGAGTRLPIGTATYVLTVNSGATAPEWAVSTGGGGGGGSLELYSTGDGPEEKVQNGFLCLEYLDAVTQTVFFEYRVPASYIAGNQIQLQAKFFSAATSATILIEAVTNLWEDDDTSSADSHSSTNAAVTQNAANEIEDLVMDLTDGSGQINSNAVAPGDLLRVQIRRDTGTDTSTSAGYLIKSSLEVILE